MSEIRVNNITDTGGSTLLGRRNAIINGNFDVWQRGTSQTATGYGSADRWKTQVGTSTQTVTQQAFTTGQTDVPYNPKYYYRNVVTTGSTAPSYVILNQFIEGVGSFAGETVTLSFYAKADASKNIAIEFSQQFGTGGSPSATVNGIGVDTVSLTASWAKYTVTVSIPSISGKTLGTDGNDSLQLFIWLDAGSDYNARTNSLGNQSGTFDIAQVQLEKGSVATDFERRSYGEELALCQRYYQRINGDYVYTRYSVGHIQSTTALDGVYFFSQEMRGIPTLVTSSTASEFAIYKSGTVSICNALPTLAAVGTTTTIGNITASSTGLTAGQGAVLIANNNTNTFMAFDAEL